MANLVRAALSAGLLLLSASALAQTVAQRQVLPIDRGSFQGRIGPTAEQSQPAWPQRVRAPEGAPNVLLVLTDDVGFGASSAFGGPIPTPNLERLAAMGAKYNRFHTTGICSPTRAALLTGRQHHDVGFGHLLNLATGFPGYDGFIPPSAATIAQTLRLNGFNTAMFGKHHNLSPDAETTSGPFDQWPTGLGFEYFYGFTGGDASQWNPRLFRGTDLIEDTPSEDLLDKRLIDDAIRWIHNQQGADPDKPFFLYLAPGSMHAPHQAPRGVIDSFKGKFDQGWDAMRRETYQRQLRAGIIPAGTQLTLRPAEIPAWDGLSADEKKYHARLMEVAAASLAYQDAQFGRLLDELARMRELDNTLVIFIAGDNGASAEGGPHGTTNEIAELANNFHPKTEYLVSRMDKMGGPESYENYGVGWAWAMNTPLQWTKQISSHLGGVRNGMVMAWPARAKSDGKIRSQFADLTDVAPTILDAAGLPAPTEVHGVKQDPLAGASLLPSFADPRAKEHHPEQYFEIGGAIAFYRDGWWLNTALQRAPWENVAKPGPLVWELYDLRSDFSQGRNLAAKNPQKLAEMQTAWEAFAKAHNLYPIDRRFGLERVIDVNMQFAPRRRVFEYWAGDTSVELKSAPAFVGPFTLAAEFDLPSGGSGVIAAVGSMFGGWSFYLDKGVPKARHAASEAPEDQSEVAAAAPLPAGAANIRFEYAPDSPRPYGGGTMRIFAGDKQIGEGRIAKTALVPAGLRETFDIGRDLGDPVVLYAKPRGVFEGRIKHVMVTLPAPSAALLRPPPK
jgi:arylsulfatase